MNRIFFPFLFALVLTRSASAQEMNSYSVRDFSLRYPSAWRLDSSKAVFNAVYFFSPLDGPEDKFSENVNVLVQDLRGKNIDLAAYRKITEDQISSMAQNGKVFISKIETDTTGERYLLEYQMTMNGNGLHFKTVCRIKNEMAYLATFTATDSSFARYDNLGSQMLASFRVK